MTQLAKDEASRQRYKERLENIENALRKGAKQRKRAALMPLAQFAQISRRPPK